MPVALEKNLKKEAKKKGFTGKRFDHYVYGGMYNWKKRHEAMSKYMPSKKGK